MSGSSSGNEAQIEYWNGQAGATWVEIQDRIDETLGGITEVLLARAGAAAGERVLDVGCGCGTTSMALAAAGADVLGVDISEPMLGLARERGASLGDRAPQFLCADASSAAFAGDRNLLFSRFGVMFFADPVAAFGHMRGALAPGGRLCFACWQAPAKNPWMAIAGQAVAPHLPPVDPPPHPHDPGPFAFADPQRIESILGTAGFSDVRAEDVRTEMRLGGSLDEVLDFQSRIGPLARALTELEGEARDAAVQAARDALAPLVTGDGLSLEGACWVVTARTA